MPERIDPFACAPPAPERPEIIADVDPGDYRPAELTVSAEYVSAAAGATYQGTAPMRYDTARKAFVVVLPPVSRANLGEQSRAGVSVVVRVAPAADQGPPPTHLLPVASLCLTGP
ncbi:hypothetical protein AB0K00_43405 [Dactylosporangium sp. NPDC049525]|uniref:hypothetical protein n=1 Tax=Dactylosporangium sp. NPDC049525 TaxID=3154730 RepID=UPI003415FC78